MALRQIGEGFIPGHANELVRSPAGELILFTVFLVQIREPVIRPLFPADADHRVFIPVGTVHAARERHAAETHARVPGGIGLVAVQVKNLVMIVVLLDPHQNAVTDESTNTALMGVVRGAAVGKRTFVLVLVTVDFFPATVRIGLKGIAYFNNGLQLGADSLA